MLINNSKAESHRYYFEKCKNGGLYLIDKKISGRVIVINKPVFKK